MNSLDELQQQYAEFINNDLQPGTASDVGKRILSEIRATGQYLTDPVEREQYAAMARNLGDRLYTLSGEYLPVRLDLPEVDINVKGPSSKELSNRRTMLRLVDLFWIKGLLEHSLLNSVLIDLNVEARPSAVDHPWSKLIQMPGQANLIVSPGTKLIDIFDQNNHSLLILGEPGSGKTTALLELARDLIARAELDFSLPIPVVFNLSSWTEKREPLAEWLIAELNTKYNIPKKLAQTWVEQDKLLLLLDGLDEVYVEYRAHCVEAINYFHREHLVGMVVCCRSADYQTLTTQLKLTTAVSLLPLTVAQIDSYLAFFGNKLAALRKLVHSSIVLQELAQSPLILNLMASFYQDYDVEGIDPPSSVGVHYSHLFDAYIIRAFAPSFHLRPASYLPEQTLHWLAWLARGMTVRAQTVFLIERLQPDWLQSRTLVLLYKLLTGLIIGISAGLIIWLIHGLTFGLTIALTVWLLICLIAGLENITPTERLVFSWKIRQRKMIYAISLALMGGVTTGLIGGLTLGFISGLLIGFMGGLKGNEEAVHSTRPNQGIWQSLNNMMISGVVSGSIGTLLIYLIVGQNTSLIGGMVIGLFIGWIYGGAAVIQHVILRGLLTFYKYIPLNYARFLDYCADRIFLRKVGGGYIFIHRLLMEHFASLTEEDIKRLAAASERR